MKIAFDVDGTLIDTCDVPRHDVIDLFRWFQSHGHDMFIWSGGGIDYARHWARRIGLDADIIEKCSEPMDIIVDDAIETENYGKQNGKIIKV